eukprot:scaffold117779_cov63-Phaeocystis_antarctica.AAC.3
MMPDASKAVLYIFASTHPMLRKPCYTSPDPRCHRSRPHRLRTSATGAVVPRPCHVRAVFDTRAVALAVVARCEVVVPLDDDAQALSVNTLLVLDDSRIAHKPGRDKGQLTQSLGPHRHLLQPREAGQPALRVVWYAVHRLVHRPVLDGVVGNVPIRGEALHDGPRPAAADREGAVHHAAPFHAAERGEPLASPAARDQPRLERNRVLAQLEHQAETLAITDASLALLLGVDQEHAGAKVAPLQEVELLPAEARLYASL